MSRKECIWPALMVSATATTSEPLPLAEDTAQPHAHPAVLLAKRGVMAMLEIFKPATQRTVHICDDDQQGVSIGPTRLAPDGVPQFLEALLPRPSVATFKVIPK